MVDSKNRVESVVRSAGRRHFAVVALEQVAFTLAPVLGGSILLLLLGTQILHWYWLALLAAAGLVIGTVRVRARKLSHYKIAQILDRRLLLDDSLSTAWFVLADESRATQAVADFQLRQAERAAEGIEPAQAFPLAFHRAWAITAALAAIAFGLFAVRYLVTKSLSFEQSLIAVQITPVFERLEARLFGGDDRVPGEAGQDARAQPNRAESGTQLPDQRAIETPQPEGVQTGDAASPNDQSGSKAQAESGKDGKPQNGNQSGDAANSQAEQKQSDQSAASEKTPPNGEAKQKNAAGQQSAGLMDKMKDALSSFMAKMRQNSGEQSRQNNQPSDQDKAASQSPGKAQQGQQQDARNQQSSQDQSSEGQTQAQASERTQASQGRSSDSMPEKGADAHSGIGRQDGEKGVKEAEQLAAMGKLAEIIGKRSANLTGDMTVETPSGKQQLKTAYSQKLGHHSDSGGEINRDDIPLADQQYVREYMEMVRKQSTEEVKRGRHK